MDALKLLSAVNTNVIGIRMDDEPLALLGIRPAYTVIDARGGIPRARSPLEQALCSAGFTDLAEGAQLPLPYQGWTVHLDTAHSYEVAHKGQVHFSSRYPTPPLWQRIALDVGWVLLVFQREAGPEVRGKELLAEMSTGRCLAATALLT